MSFWFIHITTHREKKADSQLPRDLKLYGPNSFFSHCNLPFESTFKDFSEARSGQRTVEKICIFMLFAYVYLMWFQTFPCDLQVQV